MDTRWRRMRRPLPHAMPAPLYSAQLTLGANQIGDRRFRACEGAGDQPHADSGLQGVARCMIDKPQQSTHWRWTRYPLLHYACSTLLGAARSRHGTNRRCWCRGACEGSCSQPHAESCPHGVARRMRDGEGRGTHVGVGCDCSTYLLRSAWRSSLSAPIKSAMPALRSLRRHLR